MPTSQRRHRASRENGGSSPLTWRVLGMLGAVGLVWLHSGCGSWGSNPSRESNLDTKKQVLVLAASSTIDVMHALARRFEALHDEADICIASGPSNGLAQQILVGAPADIFVSAHPEWIEAIEGAELIDGAIELFSNRLVLVVPEGNPASIATPDDLATTSVTRIALAGKNVPAGSYADQVLAAFDLRDRLQEDGKIVRGSNVRVALAYVARGEVEAGIVYATDARASHGIDVVWEFDRRYHAPLIYSAAFLNAGNGKPEAKAFFDFLRTDEAKAIIARHGFLNLTSSDDGAKP